MGWVIFNPKIYIADFDPLNKNFWAWNLSKELHHLRIRLGVAFWVSAESRNMNYVFEGATPFLQALPVVFMLWTECFELKLDT